MHLSSKISLDAESVKAKLMELERIINVIQFWEVGINVGSSSNAYEVVIYSVFNSMDDLQLFRDHPKHAEVKHAIAEFIETSGTIDYVSELQLS